MVAHQVIEAVAEQVAVVALPPWLERIQPHSWLWQPVAVVVAEQAMVLLAWPTKAQVTHSHSQLAQAKTKLAMVAVQVVAVAESKVD
jgi:hypothetical protein